MSANPSPAESPRRAHVSSDYGPADIEDSLPTILGDVPGQSDGLLEQAGLRPVQDTPRRMTYEQYEAQADAAYERAAAEERAHGLNRETGALYWEAARKRIDATAMSPGDKLKNRNPIDMMRTAGSLAMAVEADAVPEYTEPQYDEAGKLIDRRENVMRIYSEMLIEAGRLVTGEDERVELMLDGEFEPVRPSEVMASAIHEGGKAAGDQKAAAELEEQITQEYETVEEMETAEMPVVDPAVAAQVTRIAVKELTAAHEIPVAAAA